MVHFRDAMLVVITALSATAATITIINFMRTSEEMRILRERLGVVS